MDVLSLDDVRPYVELTAVGAGAISGALHASRRSFDFVGVVLISVATGTGGGLMRDMMLDQGPALALRSKAVIVTAVTAALAAALFGRPASRLARLLWTIDSIALGLFTVAGLNRAEMAGLPLVPSLFLGVMTCVGGGIIRDVLCRETPVVLLPGQPYAITALFAGVIYLAAIRGFDLSFRAAEMLAIGGAFALRLLAAWRRWTVPVPPDLSRSRQKGVPPIPDQDTKRANAPC
jgi:uncharacterized membrane protein YeiH